MPAYRFLWSGHDVALHHYRRYSRSEIVALLISAGLNIETSTYMLTGLFPIAAAIRNWRLERRQAHDERQASRYRPAHRPRR